MVLTMRSATTAMVSLAGIRCLLLMASVCLFHAGAVGVASPVGAASPWFSRSWQTDEGLPDNSVTGIVQTRDGYLWVGTLGGLMRFNGGDFAALSLPRMGDVSPSVVRAVYLDGREGLWLGMERGKLIRLEGGHVRAYGSEDGLPPHSARAFAEDADGDLWIASESGLSRFREGKFHHFDFGKGSGPSRGNTRVVVQSDGTIAWLYDGKLGVVREGKPVTLRQLSSDRSEICAASPSGLWVCERESLRRFANGGVSEPVAR